MHNVVFICLQVELAIWDTAGQERFHALGPIYYRDAQAALLVYDITDADSFSRVQAWVQELKQMVCLQLCGCNIWSICGVCLRFAVELNRP